jgi:hypothetical protein
MRKAVLIILGLLLAGFFLLQLIPYGRSHSNPPVLAEPSWDSAETRGLAQRACYDCHSNETVWPWYSHIAPVSWLVQNHVDEGREYLNFSEWGQGHREGEEGDEMAEVIYDGEMPVRSYLITHSEARLGEAEKKMLAEGLMITGKGSGEGMGSDLGDHEEGDEGPDEEEEHDENEEKEDD